MLRSAGFKPTVAMRSSATVDEGVVITTEPAGRHQAASGQHRHGGRLERPAPVHVPDAVGQSRVAAEAAFETEGLTVGTVTQQVSAHRLLEP